MTELVDNEIENNDFTYEPASESDHGGATLRRKACQTRKS